MKPTEGQPVAEYIACAREAFTWDIKTGVIRWRKTPRCGSVRAGDEAGHVRRTSYRMINFGGYFVAAHRLLWALHHGAWPQGILDHIDGNRQNNALANLRLVDASINMQNRRQASCNSRSGVLGVVRLPPGKHSPNKWAARIVAGGRSRHVANFPTIEEASAAYVAAKLILHPGGTLPLPPADTPAIVKAIALGFDRGHRIAALVRAEGTKQPPKKLLRRPPPSGPAIWRPNCRPTELM